MSSIIASDPNRASRRSEIGARIQRARRAARLSQDDLAKALGVTSGAVGLWETGRAGPHRDKLGALVAILGMTLDELLGGKANGLVEPVVTPLSAGNETSSSEPETAVCQLDPELLSQAREVGIDVAATVTAFLRDKIRKARADRWLEENREALNDANAFLARHGLWSDGKRQF